MSSAHDNVLVVSFGENRKSTNWKSKRVKWRALVARLSETMRTKETIKEYLAANKDVQANIKDVGGFVGGTLTSRRRLLKNVLNRTVFTLDLDFAPYDFWDEFTMLFDCAAVMHTTHKHTPESPRYRLIIPADREMTIEEHGAASRKLAELIGFDYFDPTTFEAPRLMYWPSTSSDGEFIFKEQQGEFLSVDKLLSHYVNWQDMAEWPGAERLRDEQRAAVSQQEDPTEKKGIVGSFCRALTITEVIEDLLPDVYESTSDATRFTFKQGTTAAGLVVYDDKFAYSHHSTDPCCGQLVNAFDLYRVHKFGHLDEGSNATGVNQKSYKAAAEAVRKIEAVRQQIAHENSEAARRTFEELGYEPEHLDVEDGEEDNAWMSLLETDNANKHKPSYKNIILIYKNDSAIAGLFKYSMFSAKIDLSYWPYWRRKKDEYGQYTLHDVDLEGLNAHFENKYGIESVRKIKSSLTLAAENNSYHPVRDYLNGLTWDGEKRIDTLLVDYFGADNTLYTHEVMRKTLIAAVARVMRPGCKFDNVLTLAGEEEFGKSTFFNILASDEWFNDGLKSINDRDAEERIQGAWIVEMSELAILKNADEESVKNFLSSKFDKFRPAYGHVKIDFPRQCIFVGTSNRDDFLRQAAGNRRFWPVAVSKKYAKRRADEITEHLRGQIWAEAKHYYDLDEPTVLSDKAREMLREQHDLFMERDSRAGSVEEFLDTPLPANWEELEIVARQMYTSDPDAIKKQGVTFRRYVCVAEVWCECFGKPIDQLDTYRNSRQIANILRSVRGWRPAKGTRRFKLYGTQKYYERIGDLPNIDNLDFLD